MGKVKNIAGERFGKLVVIEYTGKIESQSSVWKCICDCGNETFAQAHQLKRGFKKSCGCLKNKLSFGESSFNAILRRYKHQAQKRSIDFFLEKEEFREITQQNCYYCGIEPSQKYSRDNAYGEFVYNGIDRIDSFKPYSKENCVPCCWLCNVMKHNLSQNEFYSHIKLILERKELCQNIL